MKEKKCPICNDNKENQTYLTQLNKLSREINNLCREISNELEPSFEWFLKITLDKFGFLLSGGSEDKKGK